ncbi:MAG TPA: hypothetical protein VK119_10275 [Bacillota bacterium]|nr:hypothetical protein [Bacillota bacterium]
MSEIKIDSNLINDLYETLFEEGTRAERMVTMLVQFKQNIEEQGFNNTSLREIYDYVDSLIRLMEILSANIFTLQDNASEIAKQFSETDRDLSTMYEIQSNGTVQNYRSYEMNRLMDEYGRID